MTPSQPDASKSKSKIRKPSVIAIVIQVRRLEAISPQGHPIEELRQYARRVAQGEAAVGVGVAVDEALFAFVREAAVVGVRGYPGREVAFIRDTVQVAVDPKFLAVIHVVPITVCSRRAPSGKDDE